MINLGKLKKENMDYRYETKEEARDFHKKRKAFIIINKKIEFLPKDSTMSHYEYCQMKGIQKEVFNKITRGYYLDGNLVFYKDNFIYDEALIQESLRFLNEISDSLSITEFKIYFGQKPQEGFLLDYYYGEYINGELIKPDNN